MTTNYLDEADQLCDRIAIIDQGRIKALGAPTELKIGLGGDIVSLTIREQDRVEALGAAIKTLPSVRSVTPKPSGLEVRVDSPEKALPAILEAANRLMCRLELIDYHRPRLDDVFIAHTGRSIKEEAEETDNS
jgi:ABC-2 type transport system ATP-binding protein